MATEILRALATVYSELGVPRHADITDYLRANIAECAADPGLAYDCAMAVGLIAELQALTARE